MKKTLALLLALLMLLPALALAQEAVVVNKVKDKTADFSFAPDAKLTDEHMTLYRISEEKGKELLAQGTLLLEKDALRLADYSFELCAIQQLALIQKRVIVMTCGDEYYEIRAEQPRCLRKYLAAWKNAQEADSKGDS